LKNWQDFIDNQKQQAYFVALNEFLTHEHALGKTIYPPESEIYRAFELTSLENVQVVIIGQDPYHGEGQAHGLAFSVKPGVKIPPSLVNIYKELKQDIDGFSIPSHGNLTKWAEQGVLLLNTVLTVEKSLAHSHAKSGWETFTDNVLHFLNSSEKSIIFVLWGSHAIKKGRLIKGEQHRILSGPHPSPLSAYRGFFGCSHFSKINQLLISNGSAPINWQI
jgi:uracil-DNA glycosylase